MEWDLTDDKGKISEVLRLAASEGPQTIVQDGERFVVTRQRRDDPEGFKDWLLNGPSLEGVDLTRDKSPMREFEW